MSLAADNHVDILTATSADTSQHFKETKKSGLVGTDGIGLTIGSNKTAHDRCKAGTTQSQSTDTTGFTTGNVNVTAGKQAHISSSDVVANRGTNIIGDGVVVNPGHDCRTVDKKFEQKKDGLTVALPSTVDSVISNAVTSARETKESSNSRLKALWATKTALSGTQVGQTTTIASAIGGPNATRVSLSLTTQRSEPQQHSESDTVSDSTLNAGNNLSVAATGKNRGDNRGNIVIARGQLRAGSDTSLDAANDILLSDAANTQRTTGRNSNSGGGVGVSTGVGKGAGISASVSVNATKDREKGNGTEWTEVVADSDKTATINNGRDMILNGAQVNDSKIITDMGRDLLISSQQNISKYDNKQTSVAIGSSLTFSSMTGSDHVAASQDKMKSRFDSVAKQTGMFAGDSGFDITVDKRTRLDGAMITSTITPDKNHLDTRTLGLSDLHNEADCRVSHSGASLSGDGSLGGRSQGNMSGDMISTGSHSGHAEGMTQATVANDTITIRGKDNQKRNLANLSRSPAHVNNSINPIFDKEKERRHLQAAGLISDIGGQVADIVYTQGELNALKAAKETTSETPPANATEKRHQEYLAKPHDTQAYENKMTKYSTGSGIQRGIQAATAALQGLVGGSLAGALAGALAPELVHLLGSAEKDPAVDTIAHVILNGAVAAMQGNNATVGAAGAAAGELATRTVAGISYPDVKQSGLSEEQKQTMDTLVIVLAGLAGSLAGSNTVLATVGAQNGKSAVKNNSLSVGWNNILPSGTQDYGQAVASWNRYAQDNDPTPEQVQEGMNRIAIGEGPSQGIAYKVHPVVRAGGDVSFIQGYTLSGTVNDNYIPINQEDICSMSARNGASVGSSFGPYFPGLVNPDDNDYPINSDFGISAMGPSTGKGGVSFTFGFGSGWGWSATGIKSIDVSGTLTSEVYRYDFKQFPQFTIFIDACIINILLHSATYLVYI